MKILQLHTGFNLLGGVESMIVGLANEIDKTNDVTVCSVFKPNSESMFYTRLDKDIKKVHLGVEKSGFSINNILVIYRYLRKSDFDIVHFHGLFYYFAFAIIMLHKKVKFVYTFHSDAYKEQGIWDKRIFWIKKYCLRHKWMYPVTISPQSKESFSCYYGLESRMIQNGIPRPSIHSNGHTIDDIRITTSTQVFFHPGRICTPKNQVVLCKVFRRLINEGYDVMLLIAGSNQEHDIFIELSTLFCERIRYIGERNDVSQLLYESDGFCLPSIWEGLPVTLLEALSVGCIPICSPVGGIISVIKSGENGFLSNSSSEEDYYKTLKFFLSLNKDTIKQIKIKCKDSFEPYDIKNTADQYLLFYNELLHEKLY